VSYFLSTVKKDLTRWKQDAGAILLWMAIPLIIGTLVTSLMDGGGGAKPHGVLLVADLDDSVLSSLVAAAYSQGELGELISVEKVSVATGTEKINAGEASGFLIIPEGFTAAFLESKPVTLILKTNPAQTILPGIINDVTEILLDAGFYAEQLFADEIAQIQDLANGEDSNDAVISSMALAIQHKIQTAAPQIFPPAIELRILEPPSEEADVPLALLYLPGVILMAIMFAANGLAGDYWAERNQGCLRRLVFAPGRLLEFLAGKAVAAGSVIAIICGLTLLIGFLYHDIAWAKLPPSLLWTTVSGIAMFAWFGALQMMANTRRAANLITSMLLFPLLMLGGSFFPLDSLPEWIAAIGRKTPNGFIADRLSNEIIAGSAWTIDLQSWLIIITLALTGLGISAWRLQSGFARA
jgi:ABC-type multidrug transport system permease subunit